MYLVTVTVTDQWPNLLLLGWPLGIILRWVWIVLHRGGGGGGGGGCFLGDFCGG